MDGLQSPQIHLGLRLPALQFLELRRSSSGVDRWMKFPQPLN